MHAFRCAMIFFSRPVSLSLLSKYKRVFGSDASSIKRSASSARPRENAVVPREFIRVYFLFLYIPAEKENVIWEDRECERANLSRINPAHAWAFDFIHLYKVSRVFFFFSFVHIYIYIFIDRIMYAYRVYLLRLLARVRHMRRMGKRGEKKKNKQYVRTTLSDCQESEFHRVYSHCTNTERALMLQIYMSRRGKVFVGFFYFFLFYFFFFYS